MKFRYYITDLMDGKVAGTNDAAVAEDCSWSEENFVVDTETGTWLCSGGEKIDIQEMK